MKIFDDADIFSIHSSVDIQAMEKFNCQTVCGVDEVGRGSISGSIYAAAVILKPSAISIEIKDSKKFSSRKKREYVFEQIKEHVVEYHTAYIDAKTIDQIGIQEANRRVMKKAIEKMNTKKAMVAVIDGNPLWNNEIKRAKCFWVVKGDSLSLSIAAASIIAKVTRDNEMIHLAKKYPEYGFDSHMGYGSKKHFEAIRKYGIIPDIHRNTFIHL